MREGRSDGGSGEGRSWGGLEEREEEEEEEAREDREEAANAASSVLLFFPPRQKEAPLKRRARLFFPLLPYPSPLRQDRKEREREGKEERETEDEEEGGARVEADTRTVGRTEELEWAELLPRVGGGGGSRQGEESPLFPHRPTE